MTFLVRGTKEGNNWKVFIERKISSKKHNLSARRTHLTKQLIDVPNIVFLWSCRIYSLPSQKAKRQQTMTTSANPAALLLVTRLRFGSTACLMEEYGGSTQGSVQELLRELPRCWKLCTLETVMEQIELESSVKRTASLIGQNGKSSCMIFDHHMVKGERERVGGSWTCRRRIKFNTPYRI